MLSNKCSAVPEMGYRLAKIDMGRKWGDCAPFGRGELSAHVTQYGLGRCLPSYQGASWSMQLFGHNRHGPKIGGGLCPLLGQGDLGPHVTQCRLWPTFLPSGILIHRSIWPHQILSENWEVVPLWGGESRSPYNTMWPGPRPTCTPV